MLAGGLTPENVAEAVKMTGAKQVDVSSGVEDAPGQKNAELIQKFVQSSRA
jgi:phosphoribosylanthranilate isomerase